MVDRKKIVSEFEKYGGVLKASELNDLGLSSRQIKKMVDDGFVSRIKRGFYELNTEFVHEEVIISRLFPEAIIFLESALMKYDYTDRIPNAWQIAVNRYSKTTKFDIGYPAIQPFYIEPKFLKIGVAHIQVDHVVVKLYDRDRTMCDVLRYEKKLEKEVFSHSIQRYLNDQKKNIRRLFEYAALFNIKRKVQSYIGVWL
ncbi:MAG: type IV toxin-antitoxin system AbiEi family antitoxin domain-containing protein [Bacteroidota bacterium]